MNLRRTGSGASALCAILIAAALMTVAAMALAAGSREISSPTDAAPPQDSSLGIYPIGRKLNTAMWVWDTKTLLDHPSARARLFALSARYRINVIFLQVLYRVEHRAKGPICVLRQPRPLASFIAQAHARAIRVQALDGYPEFALDRYHPQVLTLVRALLAWNASHPRAGFDGIHFDDEPYLLIGFKSPLRDTILSQYLDLNRSVAALLRVAPAPPSYGVDVPFWFGDTRLVYRGVDASMAEHLLRIVDDVGLMDYRTVAGGPNGIIAHARPWISLADRLGKSVYIGLETTRAAPCQVDFVYGPSKEQWNSPDRKLRDLMLRSRLEDFPMRILNDGDGYAIGLVAPSGEPSARFISALSRLGEISGDASSPRDAQAMLRHHPEYRNFRAASWRDAGDRLIKGFSVTETTPTAITFAGLSKRRLAEAIAQAARAFAENRALSGFAIHDYRGLSRLPKD